MVVCSPQESAVQLLEEALQEILDDKEVNGVYGVGNHTQTPLPR